MKLLTIVAGLLTGLVAGALLVLVNPFAAGSDARALSGDGVLAADFLVPEYRGMSIAPGEFLGGGPNGSRAALADPALEYSRASVVLIDAGESLPPALAVRLTTLGRGNALLRGRLETSSTWNLMWPAEGSVFLVGRENYWPLFSADALALLPGVARRSETQAIRLSSGRAGEQVLLGAGGRFSELVGRFEETGYFEPGETDHVSGLLRLRLGTN